MWTDWKENHIPFPLMRPLGVVVLQKLGDRSLQRRFPEENQLVEAFFFDRPHETLRERIQVRASRRQAQAFDARRFEDAEKVTSTISAF